MSKFKTKHVLLLFILCIGTLVLLTSPKQAHAHCPQPNVEGSVSYYDNGIFRGSEWARMGTCDGDRQYYSHDIDTHKDGMCIQTQGWGRFGWFGDLVNCQDDVWEGTKRMGHTTYIRVCTTNSNATHWYGCGDAISSPYP